MSADVRNIIEVRIVAAIREAYPEVEAVVLQGILAEHLDGCTILYTGTDIVPATIEGEIEYFIQCKLLRGLSLNSIKEYKYILEAFNRFVNKPASVISAADINKYIAYSMYRLKRAPATVANRVLVIRDFFRILHEEGMIESNPAKNVQNVKVPKGSRKPLSRDDLERLREKGCDSIRDKALIEFMCSTGCRVNEPTTIDISTIDWENRKVDVMGKGNKIRTVMFSSRARLLMQEYIATRRGDSTMLFISKKVPYGPLKADAIRLIIKNAGRQAGIKRNIFPHLLRHTFATNMHAAGMEITEIQRLLGHVSLDTTMGYVKASFDSAQYNYNRLVG